jgi:hypothetical protein
MSWPRLSRLTNGQGEVTYTFGDGGYAKQFHPGGKYHPSVRSHEVDGISAWCVLADGSDNAFSTESTLK